MAPETHTIDFNPTLLTMGPALALPFDDSFDQSEHAGGETLSAATRRVDDLDDEDEDDLDDEDEDGEEGEDEGYGDDEDEDYEDDEDDEDEDEDDDLDDDEEEEDEEELNLI